MPLCSATTQRNRPCKRKSLVNDIVCRKHRHMREQPQVQQQHQENLTIHRQEQDILAEKNRITTLVKGLDLPVLPTEHLANPRHNWILSPELGRLTLTYPYFYAQYNKDGTIAVRCQCQGCSAEVINTNQSKHCTYCMCEHCVCEARVNIGLYDDHAMTPYWDNPCLGRCVACRKYK
jgi:hypothetical protein